MTVDYSRLRSMVSDLLVKIDELNDWEKGFIGNMQLQRSFSPAQQRSIKRTWFNHAGDDDKYQLATANGLTEPKRNFAPARGETRVEQQEKEKLYPISELVKRHGLPDFMRGKKR